MSQEVFENNQNTSEILSSYMMEYYDEILTERAVPSIEDGLKPIQRKLLYCFYEDGRKSNKPFTKSVIAIGSVLKYSPHGDASAYEAAVNLSCYSNNIPLLYLHGGNKNIYGSKQSASRYTEMRLTKFSEDVLLDQVDKKTRAVDYQPNFDQSLEEPVSLPSKMPMFLLNGSLGVAGGFMSSILPHSIETICDKTIQLIKNPDISVEDFIKDFMPSFPTGGVVVNSTQVNNSYRIPSNIKNKTSGSCILRGKVEYVEKGNYLRIYEIPFYITTDKIIEDIKKCVKEESITEIKDVKNLSAKGKIDIRVMLKQGSDETAVENKLYNLTRLQNTIPIVNILTYKGKFKTYNNVKDMISDWLEYRISTIKRIHNKLIKDLNYNKHINEGILKICGNKNNLDEVIKIVRDPKLTNEEIFEKIRTKFSLSKVQTEYILATKLSKLSRVSVNNLKDEINELKAKIEYEIDFISNNDNIKKTIIEELRSIKKTYKTNNDFITEYAEIIETKESSIPDENYIMILTKKGYLKKVKIDSSIKAQKRSGRGNSIGRLKDGDSPLTNITANSKDYVLLFTEDGICYRYKVYELPVSNDFSTLGKNILGLTDNKKITSMVVMNEDEYYNDNEYLLFLSKYGKIKLTSVSEFNSKFKSIIAVKFNNEGDNLVFVKKVNKSSDTQVLITNKDGFVLKCDIDEIPILKRTTQGKNSFSRKSTESFEREILCCEVINKNVKGLVFLYSNSLCKRVDTEEFRLTKLNNIGVKTGCKENSELAACFAYKDENDVASIISNKGIINIRIKEMPIVKRVAYGSKLKKINNDEIIIDGTIIDGNEVENKKFSSTMKK